MTGERRDRVWTSVLLAAACTAAGLGTGWLVTRGTSAPAPEATPAHDHEHAPGQEHKQLSQATLNNLGVTVAPAQPRAFVVTTAIAAVIEDAAGTVRPVAAIVGGQVTELLAQPGDVVAPGAGLLRLVRDPMPRPSLDLTGPLLSPASESLHEAVHLLRQAFVEVELLAEELARVEKFTAADGEELPVLPRQRAIDLRQQLARAKAAYERREAELDKHGLSEAQIAAVAQGAALPAFDEATWRQALRHNGLWTDAAQAVHDALQGEVRRLPWVIATIGELAASGLATPRLAAWLRETEGAGDNFLAAGALLQRGHSLEDVQRMHAAGALAPAVTVAAPSLDGDWDLHELLVQPGAHVEPGQVVARLRDARRLQLRAMPLGAEVAAVTRALAEGAACRATPLVPGYGPTLAEVRLERLLTDAAGHETVALAWVANDPLATPATAPLRGRSWQLRPGMRYTLRVPVRTLPSAFVLPAAALVRDGSRHVVVARDAEGFRQVEVEVLHADDEFAVVNPADPAQLGPGSEIVHSGAFALALALQGDAQGAQPHHH